VIAYDETFTNMILNASHIFETKQYQTANLDFKEYEQAILTHIMHHHHHHHHHVHQHYVSRHLGYFVSILHSTLLYQDVFAIPGRCAVWGCSSLPTPLDNVCSILKVKRNFFRIMGGNSGIHQLLARIATGINVTVRPCECRRHKRIYCGRGLN